jgi:phage shock protein A
MFRRISNLFYGFVGLFISGLERQNPEALLELEQENLRKQVGKFNSGLAAHAGLVERLIAQVRKLETDENDLRARTSANLKMGDRAAAGRYALRLQTVERELSENRKQMEQAETTYK